MKHLEIVSRPCRLGNRLDASILNPQHRLWGTIMLPRLVLTLTILVVTASANRAFAVCGDVNLDQRVTPVDALRVLKEAAGLDGKLRCADDVAVENYVGLGNFLQCNNTTFTAHMTWSEHPGLKWASSSRAVSDGDVTWHRVDDLFLGGDIVISFGPCGTVTWPFDEWNRLIPVPPVAAMLVLPVYDPPTNQMYLFAASLDLEVAPNSPSVSESRDVRHLGAPPLPRVLVGAVPAPKGISNIE